MYKNPVEDDWKEYKENIEVLVRLGGVCYIIDANLCPDKMVTGNQKTIGNCGGCNYFMGLRGDNYWNAPACCWVLEQLK